MNDRELKAGIMKKLSLFSSKAISTEGIKLFANEMGLDDARKILNSKENIELEDSVYKNLNVADTLLSKIKFGKAVKIEVVAEIARQSKSPFFKEYTDKKAELEKVIADMAKEYENEADRQLMDIKSILVEEEKGFNVQPIEALLHEKLKINKQ